jgi:hypothetical protein
VIHRPVNPAERNYPWEAFLAELMDTLALSPAIKQPAPTAQGAFIASELLAIV